MKFFRPTPKKGYPKPKPPEPELTSIASVGYVPDPRPETPPSLPPPSVEPTQVETLMEIMNQSNTVIQSIISSAKKQNESLRFILKTLKTISQQQADMDKRIRKLEAFGGGDPPPFDPPLYEWPLPDPSPDSHLRVARRKED